MAGLQQKLLQGMDTLLSLEDVEVDLTPKELWGDKVRLFITNHWLRRLAQCRF